MLKKIGRIFYSLLCLAGMVWFCLPICRGGFAGGSVFGLFICLYGLALMLFYGWFAARGRWQRRAARAAAVLYGAGMAWTAFLTGLMISYQASPPPPGLNVVVLGAQVYSEDRMGASLSSRVDRAFAYLRENPEVQCITTGGQGRDEPCPEALTEKNVLVRMGIAPERIFMEDKSRNTRQNFEYAMELAKREGLDTQVVVVTQNFHLFRAVQLAKAAGFTAYGLPASTDPLLFPQYYGRELASLTKWWVERLFLG